MVVVPGRVELTGVVPAGVVPLRVSRRGGPLVHPLADVPPGGSGAGHLDGVGQPGLLEACVQDDVGHR